jgi:uncharacterized damage-inducible protein DinB
MNTTPEVLDWLDAQGRKMAALVDGLTDEQLRATPLPSGWSMLGLLGHVRDSTHLWLHHVLLGHPTVLDEDEAWDDDPALPAAEVVAGFVASYAADLAAARELRADAAPGWWPDGAWGGYRQDTVLGVLLHLFADNAAHAGQLSIVRELTDGGVWDYEIGGVRVPTPHNVMRIEVSTPRFV